MVESSSMVSIKGRVATGVVLILCGAGPTTGQTLALKERPAATSVLCDLSASFAATGDTDPTEAERLVDAATQAMILGDVAQATSFLDRALAADPFSADAAYLRGQIVVQNEDLPAAVPWFCRYLMLAPDGASAAEAQRQLERALDNHRAAGLIAAFESAVSRFGDGELEEAEALFTSLLEERPIPEALYNRALVRSSLDRQAAARDDLARYLELKPRAEDRAAVEAAIDVLAADRPSLRSPTVAFALGTIFPGGGQYYTRRSGFGLLMTALAGGAGAAGYLYEEVTIRCRNPGPGGECPPSEVVRRDTDRPFLMLGLGVGAGLMVVGAIEAALHASGQEAPLSIRVSGDDIRLDLMAPARAGPSDIHWLRLRF